MNSKSPLIGIIIFLMTLFTLSAFTDDPTQDQALQEWMTNKLTTEQIIKNANTFNQKMDPHEGIACVEITGNYQYLMTAHPNPARMVHPNILPEESRVVIHRFMVETELKPYRVSVPVKYVFGGKTKAAVIYRLDDKNLCTAFWVLE